MYSKKQIDIHLHKKESIKQEESFYLKPEKISKLSKMNTIVHRDPIKVKIRKRKSHFTLWKIVTILKTHKVGGSINMKVYLPFVESYIITFIVVCVFPYNQTISKQSLIEQTDYCKNNIPGIIKDCLCVFITYYF